MDASSRRAPTRSCARSWSRRCTTCSGSSCTSSSSTARARARRRGQLELPLPLPRPRQRPTGDAVRRGCRAPRCSLKAREIGELRERTVERRGGALVDAAAAAPRRVRRGRQGARLRQRRLGHRRDGPRRRPPGRAGRRAALDLTDDSAILTALANDVGHRGALRRQVIAYGRGRATSRSRCRRAAGSANILAALAEARRRGLGRSRSSATTAAASPPRGSPTTSSSRPRSTSRGSRRRRRRRTTCSAS